MKSPQEIIGEIRKRPIAVAVGSFLSAVALTACGDSGSSTISACPDGFTANQNPVTQKKGAWKEAVDNGVAELRMRITDDVWAKTDGQKRIDLIKDEKLREAAKDIFHTVDGDILFLDVGSDETNLDDMSEVFCIENDEVYLSPGAQDGIYELRDARINVNLVPDYLQPADKRISAGR